MPRSALVDNVTLYFIRGYKRSDFLHLTKIRNSKIEKMIWIDAKKKSNNARMISLKSRKNLTKRKNNLKMIKNLAK